VELAVFCALAERLDVQVFGGEAVVLGSADGCAESAQVSIFPAERGEESGVLHPNSGPEVPISTLALLPDVVDLARRLAALPESTRAALLAALKAGDRP